MALEIPRPILDQIAKIPEAQWMPRAVASTSRIERVLRTPDTRFEGLPGYPFAPHYLETPERYGQSLRIHYVDEGPRDAAETLLCLHGEPTWSYLYRHMIPILADAGIRVIAPDLVGFGRSDKPAERRDYTFERHVRWISDLVEGLGLRDVTLFGQDWGGLVGLRVLARLPDRFARVVISNSTLPGPDFPEASPNEPGTATEAFLIWLRVRLILPSWAQMIAGAMRTKTLSEAEAAAYDAPYPDESYEAGSREFPGLAPLWRGYPSTAECAAAWNDVLSKWEKPFLTAWGNADDVFPLPDSPRRLTERIPGCKGQAHTTFPSGHFTQEEQGPLLAKIVRDFMQANPLPRRAVMPGFEKPLRVYGASISYYTGKLEGYLRYKEIPYELVTLGPRLMRRVREQTGAAQMPAVELPDGRFMTDTTPMIAWLELRHPEPPVIPRDPLLAFASRLVEDYAEEWLWRPAMHYRWSYRTDRLHLSRKIVDELMPDVPLPGFVKRELIRRRQHGGYVRRDGVSRETWDHVESIYLKSLDQLETIFRSRAYLLGELPTLADFGFFAPMFRHFAQDPTASDLMRERAPGVYEWQARLWNARGSRMRGALLSAVPDDWSPILGEIGEAYLPFLNANAEAWKTGQRRFDAEIQGVRYRRMPVSQYRVWCLEQLRAHFQALPDGARAEARALLEKHGCWRPLFLVEATDSRYDPEGRVPFRGRKVHYHNAG